MGRRKKSEVVEVAGDNTLVCPICGKTFKKTENTYCWIREGLCDYKLVCSWACFRKRVDEEPPKPKREKKSNRTTIVFKTKDEIEQNESESEDK